MQAKTAIDVHLIHEWLREAGRIALSQQRDLKVEIKSDSTPVTQIDRQIESFLLEHITRAYPDHGVLAEEGSSRSGSDFTWILDPLDGTRAFASGLPVWGISVGIFFEGKPFAGAFYMPSTGDMYWANQAEAFHNERRLVPSQKVDLESPLAFIAVPSNAHEHYEISFPRLRSLGSVTAHLAYVSHGMAAAALTRHIRIWDLAAVLPAFRNSQTALVCLSGGSFDPASLLDGEKSPEPLVAAHVSVIDQVRAYIRARTENPPC